MLSVCESIYERVRVMIVVLKELCAKRDVEVRVRDTLKAHDTS